MFLSTIDAKNPVKIEVINVVTGKITGSYKVQRRDVGTIRSELPEGHVLRVIKTED